MPLKLYICPKCQNANESEQCSCERASGSSPAPGSGTVVVDWDAKCQLGTCNAPATHVDKFGILMCAECMEDVRTYTCGILPLSPNNERSDAPSVR